MSELRVQFTTPVKMGETSNPLRDSFIRLDEAEQLRLRGKLDRAQTICEGLVRRYPDYMGALHTLGLIHADKKNYSRALDCLVRAAMLNPRSWNTLTALSGVYLRLGANEMAAQSLEQARRIKPDDPSVLVTLGEIYLEEREYELARDAYRDALRLEPNLLAAAMGLGWVCSYLGQNEEAAEVFERVIERGMSFVDPVLALAGLPPTVVKTDALQQLDRVVRDKDEDPAEFENSLAFARAAVLDRLGRHQEAWEQLVPANRIVFSARRKDVESDVQRQQANLKSIKQMPIGVPRETARSALPISLFVLGPSRSGKTSMERLLATLEGVKRGYENPIVENAVRRTFQTSALLTSNYFENLPAQLHSLCREIYVEELTRRAGSATVFTNTHPGRILDAARMAEALPNVRFIFVKRNAEDTVLRMYMRKYRKGNTHSYDLKAARDHVAWYHGMIDALAEKLQDIACVIHYEDMISDPAGALRTAAELCDLPVEGASLPSLGDDRGCAVPYRQFMMAELADAQSRA